MLPPLPPITRHQIFFSKMPGFSKKPGIYFYNRSASIFLQFNRPVGFADKLRPAFDSLGAVGVERLPDWLDRYLTKFHLGLLGRTVSFLRVAVDTSQHAVSPGRLATLRARHDVIDRQFRTARLLSTVLASEMVTLKNISTAMSVKPDSWTFDTVGPCLPFHARILISLGPLEL